MRIELALIAFAAPAAAQTTWYVDAGAAPGGNGSVGSPFREIQEAIDVAAALDRVDVGPGVYTPFDSAIPVSIFGPAGGGAVVQWTGSTPHGGGSRIDGSATPGLGPVELRDLTFDGSQGGADPRALTLSRVGDVSVLDCRFLAHEADGSPGGALLLDQVGGPTLVERCTFEGNSAELGAGIHFPDDLAFAVVTNDFLVVDCLFDSNRAAATPGGGSGTAIYAGALRRGFFVSGCTFRRNELSVVVQEGFFNEPGVFAGCLFENSNGDTGQPLAEVTGPVDLPDRLRFVDCTFLGPIDPGGVLPQSSAPVFSQVNLFRCTVIGQPAGRRGALLTASTATRLTTRWYDAGAAPLFGTTASILSPATDVELCTFYGTSSTEPLLNDTVRVTATIFEQHSGPIGTTVRGVTRSNLPGGPALHPTNIDADPRFFAPLAGDFRLGPGSPCLDTGSVTAFEPDGTLLDMGAARTLGALPEAQSFCPGKVTSEGCTPELTASGPPVIGAGIGITLQVDQLVAGQFGLFFASPTGIPPHLVTTAQRVCIGAPSSRSAIVPVTGSGPCGGAATLALSTADLAGFGLAPFDRLHLQFIARDPANPDGSGITLSNAIEVLVLD